MDEIKGAPEPPPTAFTIGGIVDEEQGEDEHVHDQLPSVEEVRNQAALALGKANSLRGSSRQKSDSEQYADSSSGMDVQRTLHSRRARINWCFVLFLISIALVVGATIGIAVGISRSRGGGRGSGSGGQAVAPRPPRTDEVVDWLDSNKISLSTDLNNENSHQYQAAAWLADADGLYLSMPNDETTTSAFVERYVLALLFYALSGPDWTYKLKFTTSNPTCSWNQKFITSNLRTFQIGATCGADKKVNTLHLPGIGLLGSLPTEIAHLTRLRFLALNTNDITGSLPFELSTLHEMDYFAFQYNDLEGKLPEWIANYSNLRVLGLGNNAFTGSIPNLYRKLTNLVTLGLDDNVITGDLVAIEDLNKMERLYLEDNEFDQPLESTFLTPMSNLEELDLSSNSFEGTLPLHLFTSFNRLKILDISDNDLTGQIPFDIEYHPTLEFVSVASNSFEGQCPPTFANLVNATHLDFSNNLLSGDIPTRFAELEKLVYLFMSGNKWEKKPVPQWIANLTNLEDLSLKETNRTGNIPTFLGDLKKLKLLDLDDNKLEGSIPTELGDLSNLEFLLLNRNNLVSTVPQSIQNLKLEMFLIDRNEITGDINGFCAGVSKPRVLVSDCTSENAEVSCSCCTRCCDDNKPDLCKDIVYFGDLDPKWEHSYERNFYQFSDELIFGNQ